MTFSTSVQINPDNGRYFEKGIVLPIKRYPLWQIQRGIVRTSTCLEDGTMVILGLWGPDDLVGASLTKVKPYQVECLTQVKAVPLSLADSPKLTEMLLAHIQQTEELTVIRSYRRIELMLLKLLGWFAQKFGCAAKTGQLIDLRLTHQDLADMLGATRVTITRALGQLEQQGLIERLPLHRIIVREEGIWHYEI
jgi:CRP-like cAMP-binding protein